MAIEKQRKKFLCIDDDRTLQLVVSQILNKAFGSKMLEVSAALNGEEGLKLIDEISPEIVLCDIQMPGIDGFEVCKRLRERGGRSAVILMSAYDAESDNAIRAREIGADAYLSKPIKKGELLFVVNFVLRVAQLNDAVHQKNKQLEESLGQQQAFHGKLESLNEELQADKRRLAANLREMTELNAQLENKNEEISSMMDEVGSRFESTVSLLANIIELRQDEHQGHSERVADIAVFMAEKLGLLDHQVENIKIAARLHELGIVCLPKNETMEIAVDETQSRMHSSHPLVGEMLLKGYPGFEMVADIIRHLHENVDGSGSPDGVYGERIPIGARVVSVASYFDHSRQAQPGKSVVETLNEMDEKSGAWFDEQAMNLLHAYIESRDSEFKENTIDCTVFSLKEGMELASDIYSESGINLLRKGAVLDEDNLAKILKFNNVDPIVGPIRIKQN